MLKFFRRYQKIFFVIIAFIIIVTFSFFGTQGITTKIAKRNIDKDLSTACDGTVIKLSDVENMSHFLSTDCYDAYSVNGHLRPNFFNDGVIRNDILKSDIAKIFIEKYFDPIKDSFKSNFEKIQKYKPFVHFNDPSISLAGILQMIDPKILTLLKEVQEKKEINLNFFNCYIDLYNEQAKIQPDLLRKLLIYQEKQNKSQPDLRLYQDSIALFGYESVIDWFGKDFVDLFSQFIINTASVAKEKGYKVTYQEALTDLISNLKSALKDQMRGNVEEYYTKMLSSLGMDEKKVINIWQNVLLFRKYFKDVSNNTLIDNLAYKEFADFSRTKAVIKLYNLPRYLIINNVEDMIRFEMYLLATTNKFSPLDIPNSFKTVEEIEKNYPELVEKKYVVDVRQTNLEKIALKVKTKDMYSWMMDNKNWQILKNKFSFIPVAKTSKEKLDFIDNLESTKKTELEKFSRLEIIKENPKLIDESLASEEETRYDLYFSKDSSFPIEINNAEALIELLDKQDQISNYTQDNNNYFSVCVVQRPNQKTLVTFEKALKDKIIDKILDGYLQKTYPEKTKDKEFDRIEIAKLAFEDVFNKLKTLNLSKDTSLDNLAKNRLYIYVENAMQNIHANKDFIDTMNPQFKFKCESLELSRTKNPTWVEKTAFSMEEKRFSPINLSNLEFFFLEGFSKGDIPFEKVDIAKNAISLETSNLLARKLIKTFVEKKCIVLPIRVQ